MAPIHEPVLSEHVSSSGHWMSGNKTGVGTCLSGSSRLWFTLQGGIISECFYPTLDTPQIRRLEFLIWDDGGMQIKESELECHSEEIAPGVAGFRVRCQHADFETVKEVFVDPDSCALLIRFELISERSDLSCTLICQPHLDDREDRNTAAVLQVNGMEMLAAWTDKTHLVVASDPPFLEASCVPGVQHDLGRQSSEAGPGQLLMQGRLRTGQSHFLALSFAPTRRSAVGHLLQALAQGCEARLQQFLQGWPDLPRPELGEASLDHGKLYGNSVLLFHTLSDKQHRGALPASPCIPWGEAQKNVSGYHLVWTRDLCNVAMAQLACGLTEKALHSLVYLSTVQRDDGSFPQNFWMSGEPNLKALQLDEVAAPVILAAVLERENALGNFDPYPLVRNCCACLLRSGPFTQQDRWEEAAGFSPYTLACCIAALWLGSEMAERVGESRFARICSEQAEFYNEHFEKWTVTCRGELVSEISRHYVRINPGPDPQNPERLKIANQPKDQPLRLPPSQVVSTGFLEAVRYGLRSADDPLIRESLKVVDGVLRRETPAGPAWYRYNEDGYGEQKDGRPFQGHGVGRLWPLLTAERAMYEVRAGNRPEDLVQALEAFAGPEKLLSEQVWDGPPGKPGTPTGSARPLLWAHAEYVKLLYALRHEQNLEFFPQLAERAAQSAPEAPRVWTENCPFPRFSPGFRWRIIQGQPFWLFWTTDGWETRRQTPSQALSEGVHLVDLQIPSSQRDPVEFTFFWTDSQSWRGRNFRIEVDVEPRWGEW